MLRSLAIVSAGLAIVAAAAGRAIVAERADEPILVGSFNIRYANRTDGPNAWEHREPLVIAILKEGDFWGLQEALPEQVAAIAKALPEYDLVVRSREADPAVGEACPILYRRDRWALDPEEHGTYWLSETPEVAGSKSWDASLPRIATFGRFLERSTGRALYIVNIHLDHRGATSRLEAARLVAKRIAGRKHADPVLLLGDFNTGPETPPIRALLEDPALGLVDAWRSANRDAEERGTFNGWAEACAGARIDFVLASPALLVERCVIDDRKPQGRWPSDHAAVRASLRWGS